MLSVSFAGSKPHRSIVPGLKFSMTTSLRAISSSAISRPSGFEISKVISRLPRAIVFHQSGESPLCGGHSRRASGLPGFSALITSAPKSASSVPTNGPASIEPSSSTRTSPRAARRLSRASVISPSSSDSEAVSLRIVRIEHELVQPGEISRTGDFRHPGVERSHLSLGQHAPTEQRSGDALRDDLLVLSHQSPMDEDRHHVRCAGAARRTIEGTVREDVNVLVSGTRRPARPPDGDEVDALDVRQRGVLNLDLLIDRLANGEAGADQRIDVFRADLEPQALALHSGEEAAAEGDVDRHPAMIRHADLDIPAEEKRRHGDDRRALPPAVLDP